MSRDQEREMINFHVIVLKWISLQLLKIRITPKPEMSLNSH